MQITKDVNYTNYLSLMWTYKYLFVVLLLASVVVSFVIDKSIPKEPKFYANTRISSYVVDTESINKINTFLKSMRLLGNYYKDIIEFTGTLAEHQDIVSSYILRDQTRIQKESTVADRWAGMNLEGSVFAGSIIEDTIVQESLGPIVNLYTKNTLLDLWYSQAINKKNISETFIKNEYLKNYFDKKIEYISTVKEMVEGVNITPQIREDSVADMFIELAHPNSLTKDFLSYYLEIVNNEFLISLKKILIQSVNEKFKDLEYSLNSIEIKVTLQKHLTKKFFEHSLDRLKNDLKKEIYLESSSDVNRAKKIEYDIQLLGEKVKMEQYDTLYTSLQAEKLKFFNDMNYNGVILSQLNELEEITFPYIINYRKISLKSGLLRSGGSLFVYLVSIIVSILLFFIISLIRSTYVEK